MEHIYSEHSKRKITSLNGDWLFCIDKNNIGEVNNWFSDFPSCAQHVNVPSCWNLELDLFNYVGKAWYKKEFTTTDTYLQIAFGSVTGLAKVYLDGEFLGEHYGGWLGFEFSKFVNEGSHTLVVCVDNSLNYLNTIPLKNADWYNFGGITRSVEICEFNNPYIKNSRISYELNEGLTEAEICLQVTINNPFEVCYNTELEFYLNNKLIRSETISVQGSQTFKLSGIIVKDLELWDVGNANLYDVRIAIKDDDLLEKIGFRKIEAKEQKIYLNNKSIFVKGVNRHEQHPDWGFAVPSNINKRDVDIIKKLNCNFVRGSHYPNTHTFLDYLDREGIMFWSEIPMWGFEAEPLADELTKKRALQMHKEMVEQYYNHPCIVFWGLHNEVATNTDEGYALTKELYEFVKSQDKSRLVTFASNKFQDDVCLDFADVVCVNKYYGWYGGSLNDWEEFISGMRQSLIERGQNNKPIIMSEFGAAALYGNSTFNVNRWSMEYQSDLLECVIEHCVRTEGICGTLIWQFCDSPSNKDVAKANGFNNKGVLDAYRRPKTAFRTIKKLYSEI